MVVNEREGTCQVIMGGQTYDKMLSLNLKCSRNEATPSGTIVLSWPGAEVFSASGLIASAFQEGGDGQIILDGQLAATITLDSRISKGTPKSYELTLNFRGQASELIDSSPNHETGQENQKTPIQVMQKLMEGHKTQLEDKSGGAATKPMERFIVAEGETIERACRRCAREFGLSFFENPQGNWTVLGPDSQPEPGGGELRLGYNFTHWSTNRNLSPRMTELGVFANGVATDGRYGEQNENLLKQLTMNAIGNSNRMLRIAVDGDHDRETLANRAEMERGRRAAQALNVVLKMSTWRNNSGVIWKCNQRYHVVIPVDEIDDDLDVDCVEYELTPESRNCTVTLVSTGANGAAGISGVLMDGTRVITVEQYEDMMQREGTPVPQAPGYVPR